jgi:zinc finger FYVE domain-containing protein 1
MAANHQKEDIPHNCSEQCQYNKTLDNETMKCLRCDREGRNTTVYGKLIASNDSLVEGIVKYVWCGFVIECPKHGEIYRSRKYWYGNNEPKDVTRVEVIHIWPEDNASRLASDVTPRKVVEAIRTASRFVR